MNANTFLVIITGHVSTLLGRMCVIAAMDGLTKTVIQVCFAMYQPVMPSHKRPTMIIIIFYISFRCK